MTVNVHQVGDVVKIELEFYDFDSALINPSTITLRVMDPSGNVATYLHPSSPQEIEQGEEGTGHFYSNVVADEAGDWHYEAVSTGGGAGTQYGQFSVEPRRISS